MCLKLVPCFLFFFFFNDTATTEIYTLSLHDALPIYLRNVVPGQLHERVVKISSSRLNVRDVHSEDRKSTRLNSSHDQISYAVFCLKKKKKTLIEKRSVDDNTLLNLIHDRSHTRAVNL